MNAIVRCDEISFRYSPNSSYILNKASLDVCSGDLIALVGPNGVGKSTLLNCINGLLRPQRGKVYLNGTDINTLKQSDIAKLIAYVPQRCNMSFDYTVREYVVLGRTARISPFQTPTDNDYRKVEEALLRLHIQHLKNRCVNDLSGGEQQKVTIARALVQEPRLILMDEPTSALDFGNQIHVLKLIRELAQDVSAVVFTTHNPDHCFMLNSKVAVLNTEGQLVVGECVKILTEDTLRKLYSAQLMLRYLPDVNRTICFPTGL